jgi:NADP-reducing hydrogenase subunit HndC
MSKLRMQLLVCGGTGCNDLQSEAILDNLKLELEANALENDIQVIKTGCFGLCKLGPIVKVMPDEIIYTQVKPADARDIVEEHVMKGRKVERLLYTDPLTRKTISNANEMNAYKKQLRIVLRNCGIIDP